MKNRLHRSPAAVPANLDAYVDISNRCNLRCIMCHFAYRHVSRQAPRHMEPEFFETIAGQIRPHTRKIILSAACEPTVSPHFQRILRISGRLEFPEIGFLTNANDLSDSFLNEIVEAGVTWVAISLHGSTPETYRSIHRGGELSRVLENTSRLIEKRGRAGIGKLRVGFHITLMRRNIREVPDLVRLADDLGLDFISLRHLVPFEGLGLESELLASMPEEANAWIQRGLELARSRRLPVHCCPDYFAVDHLDASRQSVQWLSEPLSSEPSSSGRARLYRKAREQLQFFWRNPHTLLQVFGRMMSGRPLGSVLGSSQSLDGRLLIIQGWALSRDGISELRLMRAPRSPSSCVDRVASDSDVVAIGRFHNTSDPRLQVLLGSYPFAYRSSWTVQVGNWRDLPGRDNTFWVEVVDGHDRCWPIADLPWQKWCSQSVQPFCNRPSSSLYIDHLGQVYPHPDCRTSLPVGSFRFQTFREIWWGAPLNSLRESLADGMRPAMCDSCPLFANQNVDRHEYWEARSHIDRDEMRSDPALPG